nr:MAG TPA: hypothetical protein [Caudoviricetes sp.]
MGPEARVGVVSIVSSDQNKKGVSSPYPPHPYKTKRLSLCNIPNFPKNTKRPLSRSNLCYT